jgi:aspartate kinase
VAGRAVRNEPGILSKLSTALSDAGINIDAVSSGMDSITFYIDEEHAEEAETLLHDEVVESGTLSSVTVDDPYAVIRVTGGELQTEPGIVNQIVAPLADEHINVQDVITSATSVAVFVDWENGEEALGHIQTVFDD